MEKKERIVERVQFPNAQKVKLLRTAAYARVSNGKDTMLHSLSAQVSYYNSLNTKQSRMAVLRSLRRRSPDRH